MRHRRHWPRWEDDWEDESSEPTEPGDEGAHWPDPWSGWRGPSKHCFPWEADESHKPFPDESWDRMWRTSWRAWRRHARRARKAHWQHRPTVVFVRFAGLFGFMTVFLCGGLVALVYVLRQLWLGADKVALMTRAGAIGLMLALPILVVLLARRAFYDIATPLSDIMAAADAVAEGDLSARARVHRPGPGGFKRLAKSFNRMVEELERADQRRRNLTADVAHELRTPLHIIQGNLEGILDDVYEPTDEHVAATLEETRQLARLVEDLRTLSLAEAGQLPLVREPVDVAELLADVQTSFSGQAEAAGVNLQVELQGQPPTILGDVGRLDQVLSNLVANALRHTPAGGAITMWAEGVEDEVLIAVRDTGEGISPENLPYIFDRFWRGDRARSHTGGVGSGLGLAIARQLVQAHDGTIGVESKVGQGTVFTITLPIGDPE